MRAGIEVIVIALWKKIQPIDHGREVSTDEVKVSIVIGCKDA